MSVVKDYREFDVWRKANELTVSVYGAIGHAPRNRSMVATNHLRRSCGSITAYIAEGCRRKRDEEYKRYLQVAVSAAGEAEFQLRRAMDEGVLSNVDYNRLHSELRDVRYLLASAIKSRPDDE